jgi:hypothetical protein
MTEEKLTPIEAISEYYRLKEIYKSDYYEKYIRPILKSKKTKREKRVEYSRLPKPECINCKRNVGTTFSINVNEAEYLRTFVAKCGDLRSPCPLDIQINYSMRETYEKMIADGLKTIDKLKLNIIKEKNNVLFFNTQIDSKFANLTSELKEETENTGLAIEGDILKNDNPAKAQLLRKTVDEFGKGLLLPFKQMIQEYVDTDNELILNRAVRFYVDEMMPKLKEIQALKYEVNFVEYDDNGEYKLIQMPNSIESKEYWTASQDKVIKFVRGTKSGTTSTAKTRPKTSTNKGTLKIKHLGQKLELQNATEALEELEQSVPLPLPNPTAHKPSTFPYYQTPKSRTWDDIGVPSHLKLPPNQVVLPNGEYDFGDMNYNEVFNSFPKSKQDIFLKLSTIKDGVTTYNDKMFVQMMNNEIAKSRGLN